MGAVQAMDGPRVDTLFPDMVLLKMQGSTLLFQFSSLCPVSSLLSSALHNIGSIVLDFAGEFRTDFWDVASHMGGHRNRVSTLFLYIILEGI